MGIWGALSPSPSLMASLFLPGRAVTVNGVSITPPKVYTGPGLSLRRAGLFLQLATRLGLTLLWDGGQAPPPSACLTHGRGGHLARYTRAGGGTSPGTCGRSSHVVFLFITKAVSPHPGHM